MNMNKINTKHAKILSGPLQVQFDITNKCNFRCLHCYNKSGENNACENELSDNEIISLFKELKKLKPYNVCFCGGEPLLRFDLIKKISNSIKDTIPSISIVTNGFLLTEEKLLELLESGINRIQISLDGNSKETHELLRQKEGSFEKALDAIKLCAKHKSSMNEFMVCFSPTTFNIVEFPEVAKRVLSIGADVIRVQPLMLSGRGKEHSDLLNPKSYQYQKLLKDIERLKSIYGDNKIDWGDPVDHIIRFRNYLNDIYTNITIQANGNIIATPYIPISFGNIKRHSIRDYWNAGLASVWNNELLQKYANQINILSDIGKDIQEFPNLWEEETLSLDILEK